ncbi:MAG: xanthine dehydrogenase family protein subunit M [Xanthobacteraceae bacterium]|nr:MAG: xanthine dehydrogenase family protein subunit M [Xanthobacteraceae bacterium]
MSTIQHYAAPRSLEEAADLLRQGNVTVLAGGTDLMPQSKAGKLKFQPVLMNIRNVEGLRGLTETGGVLRIGATTTITDLYDSDLVKSRLAALWQACDHFASDQIRNAGTIGGNICNASPAGDTLVPLLVLNARVVLAAKPNGALTQRVVPLREFFVGPGKVRREPSELVAAVEIDMPPPGFVSAFFKFGTRPALDISTISIGFGAVYEGGKLRDVRVAFGAVAPTPIRAPHVEAALEGKPLNEETIVAACDAAGQDARPISDVRASDWYRREMVRNMLERMLNNVRNG